MKRLKYVLIIAVTLLPLQGFSSIKLQKNKVVIVNEAGDAKPILRAISSLQTDMERVMGFRPEIVSGEHEGSDVGIWISNDAAQTATEAHDVYWIRPMATSGR